MRLSRIAAPSAAARVGLAGGSARSRRPVDGPRVGVSRLFESMRRPPGDGQSRRAPTDPQAIAPGSRTRARTRAPAGAPRIVAPTRWAGVVAPLHDEIGAADARAAGAPASHAGRDGIVDGTT